ncbi:hypothetical protein BJY04DRAFT_186427 [Aspergillus karnatakaensis]|uniref:bZIP transcription factor n=1 Tax=Aspergillus karnatakaensis TaxID=1810916 RepID=UPI003CCE4B3B
MTAPTLPTAKARNRRYVASIPNRILPLSQAKMMLYQLSYKKTHYCTKNTLRRSQNRQAQRRFRERKEQQKASLLAQLEALQSKHNKMAEVLETMRQSNTSLESNKRRLEKEVETLRKWREKILGVMENIVKPDGAEDDLLMKVATSCSPDCWRRGMEYSRTVIVMQTLLGIFGDDGEGQGPQTAGLRPASSQRGGDGESSMEVCAGDHNDTNEKKDRCT